MGFTFNRPVADDSYRYPYRSHFVKHLLIIALGGGLGAMARYAASRNIQSLYNQILPLGTLFVNVAGSFLIGFLFIVFDYAVLSRDTRSFLTIGFLGAFTTFSTYSLETVNLLRDGEWKLAMANLLLNNLVCLVMVITGMAAARLILKAVR